MCTILWGQNDRDSHYKLLATLLSSSTDRFGAILVEQPIAGLVGMGFRDIIGFVEVGERERRGRDLWLGFVADGREGGARRLELDAVEEEREREMEAPGFLRCVLFPFSSSLSMLTASYSPFLFLLSRPAPEIPLFCRFVPGEDGEKVLCIKA